MHQRSLSRKHIVDHTDRFTLLRKLSEGSFGKVYLACDNQTHRKYIFKVLLKKDLPSLQRQFRNVSFLHVLCHKYLVCVHSIILYQSQHVLVMDYLDGFVDLYDYITQSKYKKPEETLVTIAKHLLIAMRSIHKLGVAHRDIKPENVMINPETLDIRFIDFGMACIGNDDCLEKHIRQGTRRYVAPEIALRPPKTSVRFDLDQMQKTDLFSLGIVLGILFNKKHLHPLALENHRLRIKEHDHTFRNLFVRCVNNPEILENLNDQYVSKPLGSPKINLLGLDPTSRKIVLPTNKLRSSSFP